MPFDNLCVACGVALNCVANGRIQLEGPYKNSWIQPAAGDAGGSLGAALVAWHHYFEGKEPDVTNKKITDDKMHGGYLGPSFTDDEVISELTKQKLPYLHLSKEELDSQVTDFLTQGKVIGWFQGKMEFGPRSLGNRSIIGDPRSIEMQSTMNLKIKYRESCRPLAPAGLDEDVSQYFEQTSPSPYMLLVADIKEQLRLPTDESLFGIDKLNQSRSSLPAITHVDYSARIQTVHKETNPEFHSLLTEFKQKTGCSVLVNTSFNVRGEPPVCSPADAIRCFLATEMDYLVLNNVVLTKAQQPESAINAAKAVNFEMD